jgi:hypothetical protein
MTRLDEMRALWADLANVPAGGRQWRARRIEGTSPLQRYAALRHEDNALTVIFESSGHDGPSARIRFEADGLSVIEQRDFERRSYRAVVSLERGELREVFEVLAADLVDVVDGGGRIEGAWHLLTTRLDAWQACLRLRSRGLGREAQIGLMGELVCLTQIADVSGYGPTVLAWQGPARGLHDFVFSSTDFEVKAAAGADGRIHVSSVDQLDIPDASRLVILRPRLLPTTNGRTLPELVATVRSSVAKHAPTVSADLEMALLRAGYLDVDAHLYGERFDVAEFYGYEVLEGFPCLTRATIPSAVVDASYLLNERSLTQFRRDDASLRTLLTV